MHMDICEAGEELGLVRNPCALDVIHSRAMGRRPLVTKFLNILYCNPHVNAFDD